MSLPLDTQQKRQLYIKWMSRMALFAVVVFIVLLFRGLFHVNPAAVMTPIEAFQLRVLPEKVQIIRWNDQQVAVLYRTEAMLATLPSEGDDTDADTSQLTASHRSVSARYFVYYNRAAGLACPLSVMGVGANLYLKDSCSPLRYDLAGRPLDEHSGAEPLAVPPHHFTEDGTEIVLGSWGK